MEQKVPRNKKLDFENCLYVIFLAKKKKKIVVFFFWETWRKKSKFSKKDLEKITKSCKKRLGEIFKNDLKKRLGEKILIYEKKKKWK
jgi:hypothetical protein